MAFLGSILPSIGKFGSSVIKDIVSGKNIGQSLKNRGLETIKNLPVIGDLAAPLIEQLGDKAYKKITQGAKTKKGRKRQRAIRKLFGGRLTPAGQQMAKVAARAITGKDVIEDIQKGGDLKEIFKESVKGAKQKRGHLKPEEVTDVVKIVESMMKKRKK